MAMKWWMYGVIAVALFALGSAAGYRTRVAVDDHAVVKVQKKGLEDDAAALKARVYQEQSLRLGTERTLQQEQGKTADLLARLAAVNQRASVLQEQLDHAPLNAVPFKPVAGKCPANPFAGAQYQQLYDSAAEGGVAASRP